jgi:neutral ceramidase
MRAGASRVCITPPVGTWQGGYGTRTRPAEAIHDNLFARAVVLQEDGDSPPIAVVSVDVVGLLPHIVDAARQRTEELTGIPAEHVILCASHTHGGPILRPFLHRPVIAPDPEYLAILPKYLAGAVAAAARDLRPVTVRLGHAEGTLGINRRFPTPEGITMSPNPDGPVDRDLLALRLDLVDHAEGAGAPPLAVLFRYACHATCLGGENFLITADYPGAAAARVEAAYAPADGPARSSIDGSTLALFLQGCAGDVRPQFTGPQGGFRSATWEEMAETGAELGAATLAASERAAPVADAGAPVRIASGTVTLPYAPALGASELRSLLDTGLWPGGQSVTEMERLWAAQTLPLVEAGAVPEGMPAEVQVLRIGDAWLVALPGEVFTEIGWQVRDAVAAATGASPDLICVAAYANGSVGYVPSARAAAEGGYETIAYRFQSRPAGYAPEAGAALARLAADLATSLVDR